MQSDSFYTFIGSQLRQYRENNRMTLQEAADRIGVTKKTVGNYENAKTKIPLEYLKMLCRAYGYSFDDLMDEARKHL